jgi:nicotinamide-nucleotide amidase
MSLYAAEIINTGTELLHGSVNNTHLGFLARQLFTLGIRVTRQSTVPDGDAIRTALIDALYRCGVLLVTGGLGPTADDVTREITADLLGAPLRTDESVAEAIRQRYERRSLPMPPRVLRQALVPRGATVLPNINGTAPGLYFPERAGKNPHLFLLPGPPRELQPMVRDHVLPRLASLIPANRRPVCKIFRVAGLGESHVEEKVGEKLESVRDLEFGYCARPGEVDVRLIGSLSGVQTAENILRQELKTSLYSIEPGEGIQHRVVELLRYRGNSLAVAESCTGGELASRITDVPGSSEVFLGGYITYSNEQKAADLGVSRTLLREHGAVSAKVAAAMVRGAAKRTGADYALATTGIAGPGGGSEEKPVGTVYIAFLTPDGRVRVSHHRFSTDRDTFKQMTVHAALDRLRIELE